MSIQCNRCQGTGFLNYEDAPEDIRDKGADAVADWVTHMQLKFDELGCSCHINPPCSACVDYKTDVEMCDCCADGVEFYDIPGQHYNKDVQGPSGFYAYNGGLCECH